MIYAEIIDNTVQQYPITIMQIRTLYPNVSWPNEPNDSDLNSRNLYKITELEAPTPTKHQTLSEGNPAYNSEESRWEQNWILTNSALTEAKLAEKDTLANVRWEKEEAGVEWDYDGLGTMVMVHTDRDSQGKQAAAYVLAAQGLWEDGKYWKFMNGVFLPMTKAQIMSMALASAAYVQSCFEREAVISAGIDAATSVSEVIDWTWEE